MLCGFREVSRFVKTTRIHLKQATYLHCTVEIGHFALYPVRLKSISDPFKNIRNETIYQCDYPVNTIGSNPLIVSWSNFWQVLRQISTRRAWRLPSLMKLSLFNVHKFINLIKIRHDISLTLRSSTIRGEKRRVTEISSLILIRLQVYVFPMRPWHLISDHHLVKRKSALYRKNISLVNRTLWSIYI